MASAQIIIQTNWLGRFKCSRNESFGTHPVFCPHTKTLFALRCTSIIKISGHLASVSSRVFAFQAKSERCDCCQVSPFSCLFLLQMSQDTGNILPMRCGCNNTPLECLALCSRRSKCSCEKAIKEKLSCALHSLTDIRDVPR